MIMHIVFSCSFCFRVKRAGCFIRDWTTFWYNLRFIFTTLHWRQSLLALRFYNVNGNYETQHSPSFSQFPANIFTVESRDYWVLDFNRCSPWFCPRPSPNFTLQYQQEFTLSCFTWKRIVLCKLYSCEIHSQWYQDYCEKSKYFLAFKHLKILSYKYFAFCTSYTKSLISVRASQDMFCFDLAEVAGSLAVLPCPLIISNICFFPP